MKLWKTLGLREHLEDYIKLFKNPTKLVVILQFVTVMSVVPVGYHMIALNVPAEIIQACMANLTEGQFYQNYFGIHLDIIWAIIVASQSVGAFVACFFIGTIKRIFGTKNAMFLVNNIILIIGSIFLAFAKYYYITTFLIIGRFLIGVNTGLACALVPLFIQELAQKEMQGALSCFVHIGVCAGAALGGVLSIEFLFGNADTWHYMLAFPGVIAVGLIFYSRKIPNCPEFLLQQGDVAGAVESIKFYYGTTFDNDEITIKHYKTLVKPSTEQISFNDAYHDPNIRRGILLGMLVSAAQIFSGCMATVSYSTSMFNKVFLINYFVAFVPAMGSIFSIVLTLPALRLVKIIPRKELLINTLFICAIANFLMMVTTLVSENFIGGTWVSYIFGLTFVILGIGYNVGVGPVTYFIPGELVPDKAINVAYSCSVAVNWLVTMITNFFYYPLFQAAGGWSYLIFVIPTAISMILIQVYLPNISGTPSPPAEKLVLMCNVQQDYFSDEHEEEEDRRAYGTFDSGLSDEMEIPPGSTQTFH